ncbi:DsbE family thiol:disulfide interchange protein [Vibrio hippocampi]|uniref:Thiol:disulfide interchange protein DsbE n=1 Tax=Vibrio hippocampi TaxID=654686 RepID=A0ABN8DEU4_9VIBR|nr:DsbE family thiol:disulfide interchange protein [Vibrio hippocampi]CAH0525236.1 Thiol:disulfide interchange protein DsbE [Vibrio hippocampi]
MSKKLLFIPLVLFLLLVVVFAVQLGKNQSGDDPTKLESVLIGKTVPEFRLEDLAEPGKLYSQDVFVGQPLLLNVWATWCPTCYAEHQYLNELAAQGVKIIGLNYKDDRNKAVRWLNDLGNPYLISLFDGNGMLGLDLGVYGAPETFLIDSSGVIRYRHVGDVNDRNWKQTLEPMYQSMLQQTEQQESQQ